MNNHEINVYPLDILENKMVNAALELCKDVGGAEQLTAVAFCFLQKAQNTTEQENDDFLKIIGFLSCLAEIAKENKETFADLLTEYQSQNGILP